MLIELEEILKPEHLGNIQELLEKASFVIEEDAKCKKKWTPEDSDVGRQASDYILGVLLEEWRVRAAVHPRTILPLRFLRYETGMNYPPHLDRALMGHDPGIRNDIAMTIFLNNAEEFDGGELVIETDYGTLSFKGDAGDAVIYPSNLIHEVRPVTRGCRLVAITWIQSLVRDPWQRRVLFDLAKLMRRMEADRQPGAQVVNKCYVNLLRMWVDI